MRLTDLKINEKGLIKKVLLSGHQKQRLYALGFITDAFVIPVNFGRKKSITVYEIHNSLIALRKNDAGLIEVDIHGR